MSFIINRWVRGDDFFGRGALLQHMLERGGKPTWVLGNRRVGKTSLLRQIHHLCKTGVWPNRLALYWDLQGAGCSEGLKESFLECLEDNDDVTRELGLEIEELEECSLKEMLNKVRRKTKGLENKHLVLLIDECEELVDITRTEPGILAPFRKLGQGEVPLSLIMAGSWRLMDLDESDSITSPFLPDFLPPLLLGPFSRTESQELLLARGLSPDVASVLHHLCLGNPHLLQVLGEHYQRIGNLELALAELNLNKVAHYFFQSNFNCLPPGPRPWFAAGTACENLALMEAQDPLMPNIVQSALISTENGVRIAPLLQMVEKDLSPLDVLALLEVVAHPSEPVASSATPVGSVGANFPQRSASAPVTKADAMMPPEASPEHSVTQPLQAILASFAAQPPWQGLLALEPGQPLGQHIEHVNQLSGNESSADLLALLDRASPEFLRGEPATERTAVYLAGLAWFRSLKGCGVFAEITDPWERLAAISERDVPIDTRFLYETRLGSKHAMVLLRCLKSDPDQRYASLEQLKADL